MEKSILALSLAAVLSIGHTQERLLSQTTTNGAEVGSHAIVKKILTFPSGETYEGETQNSIFHGHGVLKWPNGNKHEGEFFNGQRNGRGIYTNPDGFRYEGGFANGKFSGRGELILPNGNRYEGEFVNGQKDGYGNELRASDGLRYEGRYVKGIMHGKGAFLYPNGDRYDSQFIDGHPNGPGIYTHADGRRVQGDFANGKFVLSRSSHVQATTQGNSQSASPEAASSGNFLFELLGAALSGYAEGKSRSSNENPLVLPEPRDKLHFNCGSDGFGNYNCRER